ncbi:disintegrin and metalloproteinase domain-containing protein 10 [Dermacentor silvarum]|uniref:disintegrin and metalloproteinase domain-containing protein 10 n=1 Tax=Dermacentor silvarum TaxID=543639 RepID=UPI0018979467|nr:disintegrin and metalloproteinase domain-containing protein 10 [Dermacentor silvarum]
MRRFPGRLLLSGAVLVCLLGSCPVCSGVVLSEHIRHFEPLFFNHHSFRDQHHRSKRSPKLDIRLEFAAHNRLFRLRMKRDTSVFSPDVTFESSSRGPISYDTSNVLKGYIEEDEESSVEGLITSEGLFDGVISVRSGEEFFIEPASRYFEAPADFHSVMYKGSDVHFPENQTYCHTHKHPPCEGSPTPSDVMGRAPWATSFLKEVRESGARRRRRRRRRSEGGEVRADQSPLMWRDGDAAHYSQKDLELPEPDSAALGIRSVQRTQWAAGSDQPAKNVVIDPKKTTCMLYLQADHLFYQRMGSEEACIETMTRHVQKVNSIYRTTDFDQDGRSDNISFLIKRIKVHTMEALRDHEYRFPGNYGVEKFLELFSEEDYDAFCLAYMFTYRDFEGGTLGLAWTGDLKNAGGVCEKNGHYRGSLKSLNTGIVTLLNYGKHVPPIVSHVTLAHEIGHNFGSPHDPKDDSMCTPGGENGNYIMFAHATSGDKRNNNRFSPCSLKGINAVLNSKARNTKGCFSEPQDSICGNEVVEAGEECDCGWEDDCLEPCCFPMRSNPPRDEPPCKLRPNVVCSPSQGPCCTQDCVLKIGDKCRDDNGCRSASYCDGEGPQCPSSTSKPNKTICNEEFVCYMGECTGSICIAYGLQSCQCKRRPRDPVTKACELCCRLPGDDSTCKSSFEWNHPPYDVPNLFAKPGTPCDNYNGYCDVFQKCREVDPSGPLATLRKLLLSTETIVSLRRWVSDNWWGVLLLGLSVLVFLCVVVKFFGRKTDPVKSVAGSDSGTSPVPVTCNPVVQPVVAASAGGVLGGGPYRLSVNQAAAKAVMASNMPGIVSTALGAHSAPATATTSNFVKTTLSLHPHPAARSYLSHAGNGWV